MQTRMELVESLIVNQKLKKKLSVTAHKFSAKAKAAIEAAGGSCTALVEAKDATPEEKPATEE